MKIRALICQQCGAPLDIPSGAELGACQYCSARVHVEHTSAANPARRSDRSASMTTDPEVKRLEGELERLDRDWEAYRGRYVPRRESGEYDIPTVADSKIAAAVSAILGFVLFVVMLLNGVEWPALFAALGVASLITLILVGRFKLAIVYQRSLRNYHRERTAIVDQLKRRGWLVLGN